MAVSIRSAKLPILAQLLNYRRGSLKLDFAAGLSVAAVSLPSAIAYPAIAGLPTETGFFATIVALVAYAIFGPSRQLVVGPDAATCIMLASVLTSLDAAAAADRVTYTTALAVEVGLLCFVARALGFGFVANFLSRPILVGFLAGISISLIIGQITRFTTVSIESRGLIRPIVEYATKISETHIPTVLLGVGTLISLRVLRHVKPRAPGPLIAVVLSIALSAALELPSHGVSVVGTLPPIAFALTFPSLDSAANLDLLQGAAAIMIVGFGSGIVTARSFATKSGSEVDADKELTGFGAANIASGLFGGFPVTAADSRTAVNYVVGGKTQLVGLIAASALLGVTLYIADVLAYLPISVLGAILVSAGIDLIDVPELRTLYRISRPEFAFAIATLLGVAVIGVLQGVFIAIATTLAHLLWLTSRPRITRLGRVDGKPGLYKLHRHPDAREIPGLTIVILQAALVFFNADYVKRQIIETAGDIGENSRWLILDAEAINLLDSTGIAKLEELQILLKDRGVAFGIADLNSRSLLMVEQAGLVDQIGGDMIFGSSEAAVAAFIRSRDESPDHPS
ncbi:SulP family inorganic anion transporter [Nitrobacter winogradskyi]|uniref:High affinity sulfate transporter 1 n=2 Tax=Nitrobacter winogradskyi TaxID=913 RepID=A0ACC6AKP9_NITWI|nr:SulP family inorganic anion transporter [Nitrobacter winogradskyi]MCP1999974.1 high affinity sulfate transporter 1 [Nitrobacter winogradskyi]